MRCGARQTSVARPEHHALGTDLLGERLGPCGIGHDDEQIAGSGVAFEPVNHPSPDGFHHRYKVFRVWAVVCPGWIARLHILAGHDSCKDVVVVVDDAAIGCVLLHPCSLAASRRSAYYHSTTGILLTHGLATMAGPAEALQVVQVEGSIWPGLAGNLMIYMLGGCGAGHL